MKIALIADIHEDIVHLKRALSKIEKLQCDEIICLGDISGFSVPHYRYFDTRNAHECLKLVRENCTIVIAGNHDLSAAKRIPEFSPDFQFPANWYELDYHERHALSQDKVWLYDHDELDPLYRKTDLEFLKTIPEKVEYEAGGKRILLTHYIYPNLSGAMQDFYHDRPSYTRHFNYMNEHNCSISFVGHAHTGGLFVVSKKQVKQRRFGRKVYLDGASCIVVPSIAGNQISKGFCIFDTVEGWVKGVRV